MSALTATSLFAHAYGVQPRPGSARCFYCGAPCPPEHPAKEHIKPTFTERAVAAGGSHVCDGCMLAFSDHLDVVLPDGSKRSRQRVRNYSWVVTRRQAVAATKAHRQWLRRQCLRPPRVPYVISLSDSGQKHLLYRTAVAWERTPIVVWLDGECISYAAEELRDRLRLASRAIQAIGKRAATSPAIQDYIRLEKAHPGLADSWNRLKNEPLTRLAMWLSPGKELTCQR